MNEKRARHLAFAWHCLDAMVCAVGLAWSVYHLTRPRELVELKPRQ